MLCRATSPLLRSDFAQGTARPAPSGDLTDSFSPQRRKSRPPIEWRTPRTGDLLSGTSAEPCATDIFHVCAAPARHPWAAKKTRAGVAAHNGPLNRCRQRGCARSLANSLRPPSPRSHGLRRAWTTTAGRTRSAASAPRPRVHCLPSRRQDDEMRCIQKRDTSRGTVQSAGRTQPRAARRAQPCLQTARLAPGCQAARLAVARPRLELQRRLR
jgi:hypothetical protein